MISLVASLVSSIYIILICLVYFSKKRINSIENTIFSYMLIASVFGIVFDSLSGILYMLDVNLNSIWYIFLTKSIIIFYVVWDLLMISYIFTISKTAVKSLDKLLDFNKYLGLIFSYLILLMPLTIIKKGNIAYSSSISINLVYILTVILVVMVIAILIKNYKILKEKKYLPLFAYLLFGIIMVVVQSITGVLLTTCVDVYITFLMYFTIENPDLKMLNELKLAKENTDRANEAKTEFLSSMSHEIRTPLNAVIGFAECVKNADNLECAKNDADDIIMAGQNLLEIVNGILDISKIEAGKMEIVETEYSLKKICYDLENLITPRIREKPIELKVKLAKDIPDIIYGDMGKVREIITNLLTNAAKYTEKGIIELSVVCINKKNKSKLVISVEDTGRGIKPEKINKLFTKFQRLEEDRNTTLEGTGLGLAITKSLVEMMGGKIVVQSKYGSGSKFTVYLTQDIIVMKEKVTVKEEKELTQIRFKDKKIIIVDDNKLNLKVATRLLSPYKIQIDTVESGFECLEKIKTNHYDLILLDDMMPKMSGTDTLKELQKDKDFNIPVIALTANAITGMKEKYLSVGFDDYLAKPIDKLELNRVLTTYLDDKKRSNK